MSANVIIVKAGLLIGCSAEVLLDSSPRTNQKPPQSAILHLS